MTPGNKIFSKLFIIILSFTLLNTFLPVQEIKASPKGPDIKAKSAILIEARRGQVLYEKQADEKSHISSINKIMTALVVIEKDKLDSKVTVSKDSANSEGSVLNLQAGEKYSVEDLLYAIMLTSANDAANALAEFSGGDVLKFVSLMNDKCSKLNLKNTCFSNPTGLFDQSQYTTARDISSIVRYAINNPDFNRIFSAQVKPLISDSGTKMLINQNKLLWSYEGCDGGKIGYNTEELQTVVTSATRDNQRLISIVLDTPADSALTDSSLLLDYGFNNFRSGILVSKTQPLKTISVANNNIDLYPAEDVLYTYPVGDNNLKSIDFKLSDNLNLPIKKDKVMGIMKYVLKDDTVIDVNLYSGIEIYPVENKTSLFLKKLMENRDVFVLLLILIFIELILISIKFIKLMVRFLKWFRERKTV